MATPCGVAIISHGRQKVVLTRKCRRCLWRVEVESACEKYTTRHIMKNTQHAWACIVQNQWYAHILYTYTKHVVYMHVCTHVYIYIHIYTYIHMKRFTHTHTHTCTYTHSGLQQHSQRRCACVACVHVCTHIYIYIHIHTYEKIHTHTHAHTLTVGYNNIRDDGVLALLAAMRPDRRMEIVVSGNTLVSEQVSMYWWALTLCVNIYIYIYIISLFICIYI